MTRWLPFVFLSLLLVPALARGANEGFWCGNRIVNLGDRVWEVARSCPQPFWSEVRDRPLAVDRHGRVLGLERVEVWALNFGGRRFMRELEFVNGRLARVSNLGYGVDHEPGSRRCAPRELREAGETIAEVYARCGRPDHSYEIPGAHGYGYYSPAQRLGKRLVWTYDYGPQRRPRELLFIDGRLRRVSLP